MELRKGYKQTEIGVIPSDWDIKRFKEVTNAITCGVAATPIYVQESVGMPFLSASHVQSGRVIFDEYKFITKELYHQITKNNKPERGDILYTRVGAGIGQAGVIDFDFDFAIYVSLTLIKVKSDVDSNYIKFILNSNYYQFLAKNGQFAGGGVQNLNVNIVREFPIPVPTKAEQNAIANALSDADALISSLEKLIKKKRNIKQGAMQELLKPKKGWKPKLLGEVCTIIGRIGFRGYTIKDIVKENEGAISLSPSNIKDGEIVFDKCTYLSWEKYKESPEIMINVGDIVLVKTASIGKTAIIKELPCETTLNPQLVVLKNIMMNRYYLSYMMNFKIVQDQIRDKVVGGVVPTLSQEQISGFKIHIPDLKEQNEIAIILGDMDNEIYSLEKKLSKSKMLKQGMMQELLTGKIRLV